MWTFGMRQVAGGKFIMMIVMRHKNKLFQMYEFDMRHVDGGKQQVFYDVGLLIYEKEKKNMQFDMRQVAGGMRQVYYDDRYET